MGEFTMRDKVKALCAPLVCCLPTCTLLPGDRHASDDRDSRSWYGQSRPSGPAYTRVSWQDGDEHVDRREADLLSLHERTEEPARARQAVPRRRRVRGGDISGSGADTGSGLSRWTLFKSWWSQPRGAIRLADSDDDELLPDEPANTTLQEGEGEQDAIVVSHEQLLHPPSEPPLSPSRSDSTTLVGEFDVDEQDERDRAARRARRRAKRRARELGISVEEYEAGAAAEPFEMALQAQFPFKTGSIHKSSSAGSKDHQTTSHTSEGSRRRRPHHDNSLSPLVCEPSVHEDIEWRSRGASDASSSTSSARRRYDTHLNDLTTQPNTCTATENKRPRHRSVPSTSTTSNTSSRPRRKKKHLIQIDDDESFAHTSPLDQVEPEIDFGKQQFFQDESGQLRSRTQSNEAPPPAEEASTAAINDYEHIGRLPGQ
ncbi:hypothetical protein OIV83_004930 [Microbotryomycetes sp. JL201]|nr:hypothetical protein OIV83_004930 [Microbotryomycetes sp. JL201]